MRSLLLALILLSAGCGKANSAEQARAERAFTDQAGYTCFIIRDEEGKGVGGNCIRD